MLMPRGIDMLSDMTVSKNDAVSSATEDSAEEGSVMVSFLEWFETLPVQNEAYETMTDDEILSH